MSKGIKELTCLYEISKIDEYPELSIEQAFQMTIDLIPPAMNHPDRACARITYLNMEYKTQNFQETGWKYSITQNINNRALIIDFNYLEDIPILKEEKKLIKEIGYRLKSIIERKEAQENLRRIEWLLKKEATDLDQFLPIYGDLTVLNTERTIIDAVGPDLLKDIASEFLDLMETSGAIYEKNGDYALGIFSSKWCRFLDAASRNLCNTKNNKEALESGKWFCHESCWNRASRISIEKDREIDIICDGGIHIFAIPIKLGNQIIGSINVAYGDPPKNLKTLQRIAEKYKVNIEDLTKLANTYESRPHYIIEVAKKRLRSAARTIGYLVERKKAETALMLEKQFTDNVLNTSMDTIFVFNPNNGKAIRWNDAFRVISGYSDEEIASLKAPDAYYDKEDLKRAEEATKKLLEKGEITFEMSLITKNDHKIPFEYSGKIFKAEDDIPLIVSFGRDISERKEAQRKLQDSERKYRELVDLANSIVVRIDKEGQITFINKFGESFFEYSMEDLLNKHVIGTIVPKTETSGRNLEEMVKSILNQPEKYTKMENENITKTDKRVWVSWRNKALVDKNGNFNGLLSTGIDITERKKAEKLLKESEKKYREAYNRVDFYKNLIAHDMNNVLQTIQSSVELYKLIQKDPENIKSQEDIFNIITHQVSKGASIVSNIIKLSKIEDTNITKKPVEIKYVLNKAVEHIFESYEREEIELTIAAKEDEYYAQANDLLLDLFDNLLINAVKYNENELKTIEIKVSEARLDHNDYIKIQFIDNGIGIPNEKKKQLFERGYHKKEKSKGLGIGLSLVNQIIHSYNGKIWVENRIKDDYTKGSNFVVLLPKATLAQ